MDRRISSVSTIILIISLLAFLQFSCSKESEPGQPYIEEIINGVHTIHNIQPDIYKKVEFLLELEIGAETGIEESVLNDPTDIDVDSKGNIYVLESKENTIKKYDIDGNFIQQIGRFGQGPGEFIKLEAIEIDSQDRLCAYDSTSRKLTIFNVNGYPEETILFTTLNVRTFKIMSNNTLLIGQDKHNIVNEQRKRGYAISSYNTHNGKVSDIYWNVPKRPEWYTIKKERGVLLVSKPIQLNWITDLTNNIYLEDKGHYEVGVYSVDQETSFRFNRTTKSSMNKKQDWEEFAQELNSLRGEDLFGRNSGITIYPYIQSISIDEAGRIWVEPFVDRESSSGRLTLFDVFYKTGIYAFSTKVDRNLVAGLLFKNERVYSILEDDMGYRRAIRFRIIEE